MEIPSMYQKFRYFSNPKYLYHLFSQSSPTLSKTPISLKPNTNSHSNTNPYFSSTPPSFSQSPQSLYWYRCNSNRKSLTSNLGLLAPQPRSFFRSFSDVSSTAIPRGGTTVFDNENESMDMGIDGLGANASPNQVTKIVELIKRGETDMELSLNLMNVSFSTAALTEIFGVLNCERVSALRFFIWIRGLHPKLHFNSDICSLIIDNCGWLDDYDTMKSVLKDFKTRRVCLTKKAFGFLPVFSLSKASAMDSIRGLIIVLDEVGGSCRSTGIRALIEMLSDLGSLEMAKFVIEITERKPSYYNILILEQCRRCNFKEAQDILEEMEQLGCNPDSKSYNYILSSLCKNNRTAETHELLVKMQKKGCPPDAITFEIFIYYSTRLGKLDFALEFLDQMVSRSIEPRLTTHAAFIRGYLDSEQNEEAYNYVVDARVKYKDSSNFIYSLLASLHRKKGNLLIAQKILIEMMDKGLRPHLPVYMKVLRQLQKSRRGDLASDLKIRYSGLSLGPCTETG